MAHVKKGTKVKIFYTCKLKNGTVVESNVGKTPLEFVVGKGKMIKGFDTAVIGMNLGQTKTVVIKPAEAYGPKDPALVKTIAAAELPAGVEALPGGELDFTAADGSPIFGRIEKIEDGQITIDGNHPLAGRNLTFEIKLVEVG